MDQKEIEKATRQLRRLVWRSGMPLRLVTLAAIAISVTEGLLPLELQDRNIEEGLVITLLVGCVLYELNTAIYMRRAIRTIECLAAAPSGGTAHSAN